MPIDDRDQISDPQRIRAMTHPIRLRLLDYLGTVTEATATECAEHVGESVASCSFHLRMLAKYDFIERAPSRGREKPWRVVSRNRTTQPDFDVPESVQATSALGLAFLEFQTGLMRDWLERAHRMDPEWALSTLQAASHLWMTREEMADVSQAIVALTDRFAGRWEDPEQRPQDARPVRLFAMVFPDSDPGSDVDADAATDDKDAR
jgi:hypothetical protein